jgi:predicted transcriptional regulator
MIRNLKEMGMSNREIAKELGVSRNTVSKMLKKTKMQDKKRKRGSTLDPYRERIKAFIDEHNLSAVRI